MYQYYRFLYDVSTFKKYVAHVDTQYIETTSLITDIVPFSNALNVRYVWWLDIGEKFINVPVNEYRVYWMVNNGGHVKNLQSEIEIDGHPETKQNNPCLNPPNYKFVYLDGGVVSPDPTIFHPSTEMTLFCKLHNRDCRYPKDRLYVYCVLLVPTDLPNPPKLLCKKRTFELQTSTNDDEEDEYDEEEDDSDYDPMELEE